MTSRDGARDPPQFHERTTPRCQPATETPHDLVGTQTCSLCAQRSCTALRNQKNTAARMSAGRTGRNAYVPTQPQNEDMSVPSRVANPPPKPLMIWDGECHF